ncbi:MAG: hypothetical protein NTY77_08485, partial [Elusimicrobia bacterium]|nr:hypothetical protein [Elusimicrobiota bacterium]
IGTYSAGRNPKGGIAVDASGDVWVMNAGVSSVTKLSPAGNIIGTYKGVTTGGNLGDFTGFALQNFVMRKPGSGRGGRAKVPPIQGPPPVAEAPPLHTPWTRLKDMPIRLVTSAQAEIGGIIYLAGGVVFPSPEPPCDSSALWAFDPSRQTWSQLPPMTTARHNAASGVIDGKLYVVGGATSRDRLNSLEVYDPETKSWGARAPVPAPGMSRGVAVDGVLYVLGRDCSGEFWGYDPRADSWKRLSPMPTGRCDPGMAAFGGRIYVLGGHPLSGPTYDIVEVYDPKNDSWSAAPPMPTARSYFPTAVLDGKIHALGGHGSGNSWIALHEAFDPATGLWYEAAPLPVSRSQTRGVVARGRLYVLGGSLGTDSPPYITAAAEVYDPAQDRLRPIGNPRPSPPVAGSGPSLSKTPYVWVAGRAGTATRIDTAGGKVTTFPAPAGSDQAVDASGDLWFVDANAPRIHKVDALSGAVTSLSVGFIAQAMALDASGDIYATQGNGTAPGSIFKLKSSDGSVIWTRGLANPPDGLAVDASGDVWVAHCPTSYSGAFGSVTKFRGSDGTVLGTYGVGIEPRGVAVDASGDVWVANGWGDGSGRQPANVTRLDGSNGALIGTYPAGCNPDGIAVDASGNVWLADFCGSAGDPSNTHGPGRVIKLDGASGAMIGDYGAGVNPSGVGVDASGHVWVVNPGSQNVTELDSNGGLLGTYPAAAPMSGYGDLTGFVLQNVVMNRSAKRPRRPMRSPQPAAPPVAISPWSSAWSATALCPRPISPSATPRPSRATPRPSWACRRRTSSS